VLVLEGNENTVKVEGIKITRVTLMKGGSVWGKTGWSSVRRKPRKGKEKKIKNGERCESWA